MRPLFFFATLVILSATGAAETKQKVPYIEVAIDDSFLVENKALGRDDLIARARDRFEIVFVELPRKVGAGDSAELRYFVEDEHQQGFLPPQVRATAQYIAPHRSLLSHADGKFYDRPYADKHVILYRSEALRVDVVHELVHFLINLEKDAAADQAKQDGRVVSKHEQRVRDHANETGDTWVESELYFVRKSQFEELGVFRLTAERRTEWGVGDADVDRHRGGFGFVVHNILRPRMAGIRVKLVDSAPALSRARLSELATEFNAVREQVADAIRWAPAPEQP